MDFLTQLTDLLAFYDIVYCIFIGVVGVITFIMGCTDLSSWQFFVGTLILICSILQPLPAYFEARRRKIEAAEVAKARAAEAARRQQEDEAAANALPPVRWAHTAYRWGEALLPIAASLAIGGAALTILFTGKPLPPLAARLTNYLDKAQRRDARCR